MEMLFSITLLYKPLLGTINNSQSMDPALNNYLMHFGILMVIIGILAVWHNRSDKDK